jgi:hypothetical protein
VEETMADQKLTELTDLAAPVVTDIIYVVNDPTGSKNPRKATLANLRKTLTPGVTTHVIFNDGGDLGASGDLTFNKTTKTLTIGTVEINTAGYFSVAGDARARQFVMRRQTTNATQSELYLDGISAQLIVTANRTWLFKILISARQVAGAGGTVGNSAVYELVGMIKRDGSNNTVLSGLVKMEIKEDETGWDVTAEADNTNEALAIKVTGAANETIDWLAFVTTVEVG